MAGRPGKYFTAVQPHLEEIKIMRNTMTEEQIAKALGVDYGTFRRYKKQYPELRDALVQAIEKVKAEFVSKLMELARGYEFTETKEIYEGKKLVRKEVYHRRFHPSVKAINTLLANWDKNWSADPRRTELQKEDMELRKKKFEKDDW